MSEMSKSMQDEALIFQFLTDLSTITPFVNPRNENDDIIAGLCHAIRTGDIPLWVSFAAQVYLDIHDTLRSEVDRGFDELCKVGAAIKKSIVEASPFIKEMRLPDVVKVSLATIEKNIQSCCESDTIDECKKKTPKLSQPDIAEHAFLKNHPLQCGAMVYAIKINYQMVMMDLINARDYPISTAHLYNALFQESMISETDFPDLRLLLKLQREENVFVGQAPKLAEQFYARWSIAFGGQSITNWAQNRRQPGKVVVAQTNRRSLELGLPVSFTFFRRLCLFDSRADLTVSDIKMIIDSGKRNIQTRSGTENVSVANLISMLVEAIQNETVHFSIDYALLNLQCWRVLRDIYTDCREIFEEMGRPAQPDSRDVVLVPGIIFTAGPPQGKRSINISAKHRLDNFRRLIDIAAKRFRAVEMGDLSVIRRFDNVYGIKVDNLVGVAQAKEQP